MYHIWAGGVAQVVECLPSKHEALRSNRNTKKKKNSYNSVKRQPNLKMKDLNRHLSNKEI
jgi:hypothetical protein